MNEKVREMASMLGFVPSVEKDTIEWFDYDRLVGVSMTATAPSFGVRVEWEGPVRDVQTWAWSMAHHEWIAVNGRAALRRDFELALVVAGDGDDGCIVRIASPDVDAAAVAKHSLCVTGPNSRFLIDCAEADPPARILAQFPSTYSHIRRRFAPGAPVPVLYFSEEGFGPRSVRFTVAVWRHPDPYVEIAFEGTNAGRAMVSPALAKKISQLVLAGAVYADAAFSSKDLLMGQKKGGES